MLSNGMPSGNAKRDGLRLLIVLVVVLILIGMLSVAMGKYYKQHELTHHLFRDFGIACLVSALVTAAYEAYARNRFDIDKIESLLNTVYGSGVPVEVWNDIKSTLLNRPSLRREVVLHLRITQHPSRADVVILDLTFAYDLMTLVRNDDPFMVVHGLDHHIRDEALGLPRFISASVGTQAYVIDHPAPWQSRVDGTMIGDDGRLCLSIPPGNAGRVLPVSLRREEVRSVPGSYYLMMTEVTTSVRVHLDEAPANLNVHLTLWPPQKDRPLSETKYALINNSLLPGHALEFQFIPKPRLPALPGTASVASDQPPKQRTTIDVR